MSKSHTITDQHIRSAFSGYYDLYPPQTDNEYYIAFENTWNELAHDIQMCQLNNRQLITGELLNAERQKKHLFKQMEDFYRNLSNRLEMLKKLINKSADKHKEHSVKLKEAEIMIDLSMNLQCSGVFVKKAFDIIRNHEPESDTDSLQIISQELDSIEKMIKHIALTHANYTALERAISHHDEHHQLPYYGDPVIDEPEPNAFSHSNLTNCTVKDLFNIGHSLRTAICIRFLSLNKNRNIPKYDAYCQVQLELEKSKLYMEDFPAESKILADRARRLENKRYKEIRLINEHFATSSE